MKFFLAFSALAAVAWSSPIHGLNNAQSADQKGVYFVLPPAQPNPPHVTPEQVEELMNQLRQEDGSDSGLYHIVLPDGRLQRVEFTTAPVSADKTAAVAADKTAASGSANLETAATPESSAANLESAAAPKLSGPAAILAQLGRTSVEASSKLTAPAPKEQSVSGPGALVSQSPRMPSKVQTTEESNLLPVSRLFLIAQPATADQKEDSPQLDDASAVQPQAARYVASVQYTEVQPITGPIYSYNPQPLTRIVRYAPVF